MILMNIYIIFAIISYFLCFLYKIYKFLIPRAVLKGHHKFSFLQSKVLIICQVSEVFM